MPPPNPGPADCQTDGPEGGGEPPPSAGAADCQTDGPPKVPDVGAAGAPIPGPADCQTDGPLGAGTKELVPKTPAPDCPSGSLAIASSGLVKGFSPIMAVPGTAPGPMRGWPAIASIEGGAVPAAGLGAGADWLAQRDGTPLAGAAAGWDMPRPGTDSEAPRPGAGACDDQSEGREGEGTSGIGAGVPHVEWGSTTGGRDCALWNP